MPLNLVILTWEYPPRIVGEMANYIQRLATDLSRNYNISVVTFHDAPYFHEKISDSLEIHRVPNPVGPHVSIVTWALSLSAEIQRIVSNIYYDKLGKLDLIDTHEWQFVAAAVGLKKTFHLPFVLTLHSLEEHRSSDHSSPLSSSIRGLEWLGAYECEKVITSSDWMKAEIVRIHRVPSLKVRTVASSSPTWVKENLQIYRQALRGRHVEG